MRRRRKIIRRRRRKYKKLRRGVVTAGTAAAIALSSQVNIQKACAGALADRHQLPVAADADADLLSSGEEAAIGYQPFNGDQNRNEMPDGVELAKRCTAVVAGLPEFYPDRLPPPPAPDAIYKIGHMLDGMEACDVCGEMIHMGGWEIINPGLGLKYPDPEDELNGVFLPDLALHYMEHGSFDCHGQVHSGRSDVARLLRVLGLRFPNDPNEHQLPLDYTPKITKEHVPDANDYDGDLLSDAEELAGGFNLYDPDQDANLVPDGIDLAMQFANAIDALPVWDPQEPVPEPDEPYKINRFQKGLEACMICGASVNMGWWEVVNPKLGLSIDVYDIVCHYMHHGSFTYHGGLHGPDRINVMLLGRILEMPLRCGHLGTVYVPGDYNRDCVENFKDFSDFAEKWLQSTDPAENGDASSIMTYNIEPCDNLSKRIEPPPPDPPEPTFTVRVEGPYILFEDMMNANCCPSKLEVNMTREGNVIRLYEAGHTYSNGCRCVCDFPTDAMLGPFEDGSYIVEVYEQSWNDGVLIRERPKGFKEVVIGAG